MESLYFLHCCGNVLEGYLFVLRVKLQISFTWQTTSEAHTGYSERQ